jgi:hypothetical protein
VNKGRKEMSKCKDLKKEINCMAYKTVMDMAVRIA